MKLVRANRNAFTLVELLVVVAIIGVLVALAISGSQVAIEQARASKCIATMRSLCHAINLYTVEHDNYLPANNTGSTSTVDTTWTVEIRPYLGITGQDKNGSGNAAMAPLVKCPSVSTIDTPAAWWESNYSVGMPFGSNGTPNKAFIKNPGQTMMMIETIGKTYRGVRPMNPSPITTIAYRHKSYVNTLFFDGHIEKFLKKDIPTDSTTPDVFWSPN